MQQASTSSDKGTPLAKGKGSLLLNILVMRIPANVSRQGKGSP